MAEPSTSQKGVLPKNLQTWVLIGITVLVIGVIVLAGSGSKSRSAGGAPAAGATPPTPPKSPTDQYAERLEQLKADAERAQQEALAARNAYGFPAAIHRLLCIGRAPDAPRRPQHPASQKANSIPIAGPARPRFKRGLSAVALDGSLCVRPSPPRPRKDRSTLRYVESGKGSTAP